MERLSPALADWIRRGGANPPLWFNADKCVFTGSMAKRAGNVFAAAPIVQGDWDGTGTPDVLTAPRGDQIIDSWYENFDPYQGSISLWVCPEWDGNDGLNHYFVYSGGCCYFYKFGGDLYGFVGGKLTGPVDISAWVAGTWYYIVFRWDTLNTLDGTNYLALSINDVTAFSSAVQPTAATPSSVTNIGRRTTNPANAIIECPTVYRRPLWDGTYGVNVGNGDEIALIYAGGVGKDPCEITGAWDAVFCLPTDSAVGALVTGTGEAWSMPHSDNVL